MIFFNFQKLNQKKEGKFVLFDENDFFIGL